jgi:hypothetical protein
MSEYMSAFDTYKTYLAVQQHFTRKTYDFFKYNGKVKVNESTFIARKDRYFFEKASRKFKRDDFLNFLIANYTSGSEHWIGNLMAGENLIVMKKWKKRIDSLTYEFKEDILNMYDLEENLDHALTMENGKHPLLYRLFLRKKVSLETMVVLDDLVGYSKLWTKYGDMMLNDHLFLMSKYRPFLQSSVGIDKSKYRKIILDIYAGK